MDPEPHAMEGRGGDGRRSRVVVVGGGVAGALLAKSMQSHAEVVLIDQKEYFEIPWSQLRSMVDPFFAERTLIKHSEYLSKGKFIVSSGVNVTEKEVLTADGDSVAYDYLVIATGHANSTPKSRKDRHRQFEKDKHKIQSSHSILIIGGGPTGVELAGEISVDFPEKKVTLVHRGPRLLEFIGPKASAKTLDWLTSRNVDVLLNQSVNLDDTAVADGVYMTSAGEKIKADCHFFCIGNALGSSWLQDSVLKECLDKKGRLLVDKNLRVRGQKNIFAIGDITDIPEMKQGYLAQRHAMVVAKNLKLLMNGAKEDKLATYRPGPVVAIVTLGRREAVAQFPYLTLIGCIPGMIKSKDLFVGKTRRGMGLDPLYSQTGL